LLASGVGGRNANFYGTGQAQLPKTAPWGYGWNSAEGTFNSSFFTMLT